VVKGETFDMFFWGNALKKERAGKRRCHIRVKGVCGCPWQRLQF